MKNFEIIHTEWEDVFSTVYLTCVYFDKETEELYYHVIPIDLFSQNDFLLEEYIKLKHSNSHIIKVGDTLEKFKKRDELIEKIRERNLNRLLE